MPNRKFIELPKGVLEYCALHICAFFIAIMNGGIWAYNRSSDLTLWDEYDTFLTILFISIVVLFLINRKPETPTVVWYRIVFVVMCLTLYLVDCNDGYNKTQFKRYFYIPVILLIVLFWLIQNKELFWRAFSNVVCALSLISLFFYVFGTWLHLISPMKHIIRGWGSWGPNPIPNYYNLYYQAQVTHHGDFDLWRNCSVFAEAPMFNMVLCMALAAEVFLFRREKGRRFTIILLIVTIISTFSTTGYLFLVLLGALVLLNSSRFIVFCKKHLKLTIGLSVALVGVLALLIVIKLQTPQGSGSTAVRIDHSLTCLQIWKDNLLFGDGWLNDDNFLQLAKFPFGISVGFPYLLKCGGIMLGALFLVPYVISIVAAFESKDFKMFSFNSLFMMLFVFTAVVRFPVVTMYIAYSVFCCSKSFRLDDIEDKHMKSIQIKRGISKNKLLDNL